ncbi:LysR family transcriptional regulator [Pseudomonas alliivorans]|uniref:LysR family transcriptional regulator n=1 Tax=Pseudomonas fragariae (ex Marin et al. 2024) TaxID=3080056 RepID=UPI001619C654|nr:LysR family transcriptional regulator [Pseudomonas alliivorans]MEE4895398.1 LysR family transcriptional regulator [Pseudomonas alliivorans]MEE5042483.1 LysR family transcriptional regulator [Pseudomonas alliivorans]MEE5067926.1 LysR family transcriptional regulator [Pseudomonas alliivorans]MEE5081027.1 LysR family transcriptional regulator [Pseudomonas alliivorans]
MELVWLEDFNALAESGNFSRAADARHVTQPAFSRRIRALESWVGVELFERTAQGATLTEAGQSMLDNARELTRRLYQMRAEVKEVAGKATRTLHFAATHSLSFTFFPAWIRQVEDGAPIEGIRLHSDNMAACEQLLLNGEVQFLICHQYPNVLPPFDSKQFESKVIGSDALLALQSPELKPGEPVPFLSYTAESGLGRIIASYLQNNPGHPDLETVFSSHLAAVLLSMALQAKGVAWLPRSLATPELASGRLTQSSIALPDIQTEIRIFRASIPLGDFAEKFWTGLQD